MPTPALKAHIVLKRNIDAILHERGLKRKDLAQWCHRTESWLSQIFIDEERNIPLKYLDRIADFFGLATYQLFVPGGGTERRTGKDRRSGQERRRSRQKISPTEAMLLAEIKALKPKDVPHVRRYVSWLRKSADAEPGTGVPSDPSSEDRPLSGLVRRNLSAPRPK